MDALQQTLKHGRRKTKIERANCEPFFWIAKNEATVFTESGIVCLWSWNSLLYKHTSSTENSFPWSLSFRLRIMKLRRTALEGTKFYPSYIRLVLKWIHQVVIIITTAICSKASETEGECCCRHAWGVITSQGISAWCTLSKRSLSNVNAEEVILLWQIAAYDGRPRCNLLDVCHVDKFTSLVSYHH